MEHTNHCWLSLIVVEFSCAVDFFPIAIVLVIAADFTRFRCIYIYSCYCCFPLSCWPFYLLLLLLHAVLSKHWSCCCSSLLCCHVYMLMIICFSFIFTLCLSVCVSVRVCVRTMSNCLFVCVCVCGWKFVLFCIFVLLFGPLRSSVYFKTVFAHFKRLRNT